MKLLVAVAMIVCLHVGANRSFAETAKEAEQRSGPCMTIATEILGHGHNYSATEWQKLIRQCNPRRDCASADNLIKTQAEKSPLYCRE